MNENQRFLLLGCYINSALYLVGCFVAGMLLHSPAWKWALAASGAAFLSYIIQAWGYALDRKDVAIAGMASSLMSNVLGLVAGLLLLGVS